MRHPFFAIPTPLVIGHRGCAGEVPENTLRSFARGIQDGAAVIESDVHLTRDRVPVLIHDPHVDRCTEGHGAVRELSLGDLQALDAGYRFREREGSPARGQGLRIPTLSQALEAFPDVRFNLELKEDLPGLVDATLAVVAAAGGAARVLVTAADDALMRQLRAAVAASGLEPALGACTGEVVSFVRAAAEGGEPVPGPMALQIPAEFGGRPLVTPALIEFAHARDVQVHVWTINDPAEIDALLGLGVDGIVSDFPARVAAAVERLRS